MKVYDEKRIDELVQILKEDGVISVPTDTVYGLCARIDSVKAYNKLIEIKNRPVSKLFSIMCADEEQIKNISIVDERTEKFLKSFMPGPITLILQKKSNICDYAMNGNKTIAVRMATSEILRDLIKKTGCPLFMSSANKNGESTCTNIEQIEKVFPNLDGILIGDVKFGQASTIVDCTSEKIKILRQGPISLEQIEEIL